MTPIFISHSPRDVQFLAELRDHLVRNGFKPWIDPVPSPGQEWRYAIDDAIRSARAVIVIITPASAESVYVTYEWTLALGMKVPVYPIIYKTPPKMHPRLALLEKFDYTGFKEADAFWDYFMREMKRLLAPAPAGPVQAPPAEAPRMPQTAALSGASAAAVEPARVLQAPVGDAYNRTVMPPSAGHWVVIRRGPSLNTMYQLERDTVNLGRDTSNDIVINDLEVSRFHLRFTRQGDSYAVEDLGSTNGTIVDGQLVRSPMTLPGGNAIRLGDSILLSYERVTG